eukprot:10593015-Heterocapsa_arctica.AAC.1
MTTSRRKKGMHRASRLSHRRKRTGRKQEPTEAWAKSKRARSGRHTSTGRTLEAQGTTSGRDWRKGASSSSPPSAGELRATTSCTGGWKAKSEEYKTEGRHYLTKNSEHARK